MGIKDSQGITRSEKLLRKVIDEDSDADHEEYITIFAGLIN